MKRKLLQSPLKLKDKDDYNTIQAFGMELDLRKWCIERALCVTETNEFGTTQSELIKTAQKIYDWVNK